MLPFSLHNGSVDNRVIYDTYSYHILHVLLDIVERAYWHHGVTAMQEAYTKMGAEIDEGAGGLSTTPAQRKGRTSCVA
jgi:hypothetical protein